MAEVSPQLAAHVTAVDALPPSKLEDIRKLYRIGRKIGSGRFGTVHEAVDKMTGVHVAVKAIPKDKYKRSPLSIFRKKDKAEAESTLRSLREEAEISQALGGRQGDGLGAEEGEGVLAEGRRNVVEVVSVIEGRRHMYLVMELCHGGSLASYLEKRRRGEVASLAPAAPAVADRDSAAHAHAEENLSAHSGDSGEGAEAESFARRIRQFSSNDLSSSCAASDAGRDAIDDERHATANDGASDAHHTPIAPATSAATASTYSGLAFLERGAFGAARRQQQEREDEAAWMAYELAAAVAYMHSQGIVHRDIKPENVLIALPPSSHATAVPVTASPATDARDHGDSHEHSHGDDTTRHSHRQRSHRQSQHRASMRKEGGLALKKRVAFVSVTTSLQRSTSRKITPVASNPSLHGLLRQEQQQQRLVLADFGLAERVKADGSVRRGMVGSPAYIAPEVAGGLPASYPSDIWGIGICLFLTLSGGQLPFSGRDTRTLLRNIRRVALPMGTAAWVAVSSEAKAVVRQLLAGQPGDRPSAEEVMRLPWVAEGRNRWIGKHSGRC